MTAFITNTDPLLSDLAIDASNSARIDALIEVASMQIERYCNRIFASTLHAEYIDGRGSASIFVANPPITDLVSVVFRGDEDETVLGTYFEYTTDNSLGEIYWSTVNPSTHSWAVSPGRFAPGKRNIIINYTGGFSTIPAPVRYACSELVKQLLSPELAAGIMEMEKLGDYFYKLGENVQEKLFMPLRAFLVPYKLPNIPLDAETVF